MRLALLLTCVLGWAVPLAAQAPPAPVVMPPDGEPQIDPFLALRSFGFVFAEPVPSADPNEPLVIGLQFGVDVVGGRDTAGLQLWADQIRDSINESLTASNPTRTDRVIVRWRIEPSGYVSTETAGNEALADFNWNAQQGQTIGSNTYLWLESICADQSMFISHKAESCGYGTLMSSNKLAANVWVNDGCSVSNLSGAHECGHNWGLNHDPQNACGGPVCTGYGFGHCWTGARDVMAYPQCIAADGSSGVGRVRLFSNPSILNNGQPTGIPNQRDGARTIRDRFDIVRNFRTGCTATVPSAPTNHLSM